MPTDTFAVLAEPTRRRILDRLRLAECSVGDLVEAQRDLLTGLLEANLAVTSNQLNQVMKKMTSWGAILIVATLIASIYGMNFSNLPALHWRFGYVFALVLMAVVTLLLYRMFKRRDWL